jgi:glycerol-3-phosphate dehydrogenase (NAD(P)+)
MLVSLTKGIEAHTFKLMSQILEEIAPQARIGVLSGPNLAREVAEHALTATVVASEDEALCQRCRRCCTGAPSASTPVPTVSASSWAAR